MKQRLVLGTIWLILLTACGGVAEPEPTAVLATLTAPPTVAATKTSAPPTETAANTAVPPTPAIPPTETATNTAVPPTPQQAPATPRHTPTATAKPYATIDATAHPPGTAVPAPAPLFSKAPHITNIILLGNDVDTPQGGRTDSLILMAIDRQNKTATMLSLPRDLFVLIPGWRMTRINLALPHGHGSDYPGAGGGLIKDTIEYNLGIPVDYYARIGFNGFKTAVDAVGGIEMVINCPLTDWRLITPELAPELEENWELFTLEPGVQPMDGDLALWFARSRRTTNDFERGLRQQRLLQAIFHKGLDLNLLPQLPDLWTAYRHNVETDIPFTVMVELAALAPAIEQNGVQHLTLPYAAMKSWRDPASGGSVQLLQWEAAEPTLRRVMQPPALQRAERPFLTVEVVTADYILYRQMADNLAWYGFRPQHTAVAETPAITTIEYFGPNLKGANVALLSWIFHRRPEAVLQVAATDNTTDYRVTLGYDANPCLSYLQPPQ